MHFGDNPEFSIKEDDAIIHIIKKAAQQSGIELKLVAMGGVSDANIINQKGIKAVNICAGMEKIHSCDECIYIDDMVKTVELLVSIIKNIE